MNPTPSTPLAVCGGFRAGETICGFEGRAWPLHRVQLYTSLGALCGTFLSGEAAAGALGDILDLPATLVFPEDTQAGRYRTAARLLVDGEAVDGWQLEGRNVEVSGPIADSDPWVLRDLEMSLAEKATAPSLFLRYEEGHRGGCLRLARLKTFERKHLALSGKCYTDVKLQWRLSDPSWYEQKWRTAIIDQPGDWNFEVDAGPTHLSHPRIRIVSRNPGTVGNLRLANWQDEQRWLTYSDANYLRNGAFVTIDCDRGTATRGDGSNALHYMGGTFLRLRRGFNKFAYTGGPCTLIFTWKVRWL